MRVICLRHSWSFWFLWNLKSWPGFSSPIFKFQCLSDIQKKICFRGHVCIYLQRRSRKLRLCNMKCIVPSSKPTDNLLMVAGARINPKWLDFLPAPAASQYIRSNFHQEIWNLGSLKYQRKQETKLKYPQPFNRINRILGNWTISTDGAFRRLMT